jgi:hypothetical protein
VILGNQESDEGRSGSYIHKSGVINFCIGKYAALSPLDIALIMEGFDSVKWPVGKDVNLNVKRNPAFLLAVRYCDEAVIRYLAEHGTKVNCVNEAKTEAFEQALYGKKYKNRISKQTGDYNDIYIVWNPKTKKAVFYDIEHEEMNDIGGFEEFVNDMSAYMQKIIEGEYE